jgi:DNA-binding PadR family transcriptional regulator
MAAPPKGNLAAIKVILSLLLDGPETHANIRRRLRRDYPHAKWTRSIVNVSLPALVAQGLIVLISSGTRRADDLYEITDAGIADCRRSARAAAQSVGPLREPLESWIENSKPEELPRIIATIRGLELEATSKQSEAQKRLNSERQLGRCGPSNGSDYRGRAHYAILLDQVTYWRLNAARYKQLRANLLGHHDLHQRQPADDHHHG